MIIYLLTNSLSSDNRIRNLSGKYNFLRGVCDASGIN